MQSQKPMYTTAISQVKANETLPTALLHKLATENQSAFGLVIREPDKMVVEKFHKLDGLDKQKKFLDGLMEGTKKYEGMFCFHAYPAEFDENEVMPWIALKDSKGQPLLAVAIEGDFPKHVDEENEFSEPYILMHDWLGPKIEAMFKTVGNSPQKLFDYLRSEQFKNDFAQTLGHRGVLAFIPSVGSPFVIENNDIGLHSQVWGSVSNAYDYTESAIEAATPAPAPAKTSGASKYVSDAEPIPAVPLKTDPPMPEEKVATELQPEEIDWVPPKGVHGKALKAAYRAVNNGILPKEWRDRPTIRIKAKSSVKDFKEIASLVPKNVAEKPADKVLSMPIIGGAQQAKAVDFIKKYLGDGSAVISDPIEAQKQESKLAKFSELMLPSGKIDDIDRFRTEFIFAFAKENHEGAALAIIELRAERRRMQKMLLDSGKTMAELTNTEPQKVTETPTPAPAQPGPAPAEVPAEPVKRGASKYA